MYGIGAAFLNTATKDQYLFVGDYSNVMHIFDTTGDNLTYVSSFLSESIGITFKIQGNYLYHPTASSSLTIFDISNPLDIKLVGEYIHPDNDGTCTQFGDLAINGNTAYVVQPNCNVPAIQIINITSKTAPTLIGSYNTHDIAAISIDGTTLMGVNGSEGFLLINIADPTNPTFITSDNATLSGAFGVTHLAGHAYVQDQSTSLHVYDYTTTPNTISELAYNGGTPIDIGDNQPSRMLQMGSILYSLHDGGLSVIDTTDPTEPVEIRVVAVPAFILGLGGISLIGTTRLVVSGVQNLHLYDISDPTNPTLLDTYDPLQFYVLAVSTIPGATFLTNGFSSCFNIYNTTNPNTANAKIATFDGANSGCTAVEVVGQYAYAGQGSDFLVIDISDTANPTQVGFTTLSNQIRDIKIVGDYAYVAENGVGISIVDISTKTAPAITTPGTGTYSDGNLKDVYTSSNGDYLYSGNDNSEVVVINATDKDIPVLETTIAIPNTMNNAYVEGNKMVVTYPYNGIGDDYTLIDLTNPALPVVSSTLSIPESISGGEAALIKGNHLYVASITTGVRVYDISDLTAPVLLHQLPYFGVASSMAHDGRYVFFTNLYGSTVIIDSNDLSNLPIGYKLE